MYRVCLLITVVCSWGMSSAPVCRAGEFTVSTFQVDVTPPIGHPTIASLCGPAKEVLAPIWIKGMVLQGTDEPVVVAAVDWCEIRNKSYDLWRDRIAEAAGTTRERVMLTSVHQHDTPLSDNEAQEVLTRFGYEGLMIDLNFQEECLDNIVAEVKSSLDRAVPVTHYGLGKAKVVDVASNRRVKDSSGKYSYARGSFSANETIRNQPVGLIDPFLKTISFWNGEMPVVAVSTYSVHPMSYYCRGEVSPDFVGMARQQRQEAVPGVFQIYCSGCSGDTTVSKYNAGDYDSRVALANRLEQGMQDAWEETKTYPLDNLEFKAHQFELSPRDAAGYSISEFEAKLADPQTSLSQRIDAALGISWLNRVSREEPIDLPVLDFGNAKWFVLPAEAFVGYQLEAQELAPDTFLMIPGYGECAPGYLPTREAIAERFDDHHHWTQVSKQAHDEMTAALKLALGLTTSDQD
ncbi:hypothetical protein Pla110_26820 [Polystyrenella longa]|uniref:Neutral/alkaline non-lysosomal ceramidase n=1 Tax=Polystyrenella longa TaxID=2528007 RepID=A0A518CNZ4_9PLAN|nr:hypothetical protein [Polystyrenella longa]QDU80946.1 hypothetical protein Pla110_26820 [Polystyrenella longa]